jgi:hypothetical protein
VLSGATKTLYAYNEYVEEVRLKWEGRKNYEASEVIALQ